MARLMKFGSLWLATNPDHPAFECIRVCLAPALIISHDRVTMTVPRVAARGSR